VQRQDDRAFLPVAGPPCLLPFMLPGDESFDSGYSPRIGSAE